MAYKGHLSDKEFYSQMCRWADSLNTQTAAKWWNAALEIIVRNVFLTGSCRIPGLGIIATKEIKESYQKQINPETGEYVVYHVPARISPYLIAADDFVDAVNAEGVTKAYRKRLKSNALTMKDYENEVRAQALNADKSLTPERIEKAKQEFNKLLKEKVKNQKAKVEKYDEDE